MRKNYDDERIRQKQQLIRCFRNYLTLIIAIVLLLSLLPGCASNSSSQAVVPCPPPAELPAALAASDLPAAQSFSVRVASYLQKVQEFVNGSQSERTQSETTDVEPTATFSQ